MLETRKLLHVQSKFCSETAILDRGIELRESHVPNSAKPLPLFFHT